MAEVAAGAGAALAVEEVLSTTVQAGVAGYFLTKPTLPLKATFTCVAIADDDEMHRYQPQPSILGRSLTRSNHSLTVLHNKAYIFGGTTKDGLASNEIHVVNLATEKNEDPDYQLIPAIPATSGGPVPKSRTKHAACAFNDKIAIYGGVDSSGQSVDESATIWLFDPAEKTWSALASEGDEPGHSKTAQLFPHSGDLIVYRDSTPTPLWRFSHQTHTWTPLPDPPAPASPTNAALTNGHLYLITSTDPLSSQLHMLPLPPPPASTKSKEDNNPQGNPDPDPNSEFQKWTTLTFPTNPIAPGPLARHSGALLATTTGYGRNYLVYLLGARDTPVSSSTTATFPSAPESMPERDITECSDTWALQLPSSSLEPKVAWSVKDAMKPAKIKDAIRSSVGAESGKWGWAEVVVEVPDDLGVTGAGEGKLHPGPRACFGADVLDDGAGVVFWGGEDAEGERVGDGWVVRVK
ncbi:hypothetical protein K458DRAFT_476830 [Lentithecium fluviatile CBS 122367]|uniref:Galactose oxidase n=1 Tax=Lentithecium fluviatile CBS 122367 TaxID=1168545 RepID=A0A6G1J6Z2_9PLEO|nr:hypothetical protein K458DRAFT_476830 [Lentithecium fluviatile CBS 122367]